MDIKAWYKKISASNSPTKKIIGIVFFILGFFALITPFTPGSWLIFVGLELLGFRLAVWDKIKSKFFK
jgi:uncharacterized protein YqgC (DUF456 family)